MSIWLALLSCFLPSTVVGCSKQVVTLQVFWGNYLCDPVDDNGELYGIALDSEGSYYGTLTCKPRGTFIASQLVSFIISKDTGRSWSLPLSVHVSGKNKLYHFQSHAVIYSVEPTEGSTAGELLVTVTGNYFDDDTVVLIGGQSCEISNVSITTIQCVTSPVDASLSGFPGNRGINKEVWLDSYVDDLSEAIFDDSGADFRFEYISEASLVDSGLGEPPNFIGRLRGFYVPPRDGYYAFSVICDDRSYLYLSNSSRKEDKKQIAYCFRHGTNYFAYPEATSEKILLEGGNHYFLEASLWDRGGYGYVRVGVHMYDVPLIDAEFDSAISEQQRISVRSTEQNEIQVLSRIADVEELQVIIIDYEPCQASVSSDCPTVPKFTLEFMGEVSGEITADADPVEIESALNDLTTIKPIGVEVFMSDEDTGVYYVSFLISTGNLPEMIANVTEGVAYVTVEEEQYGIPPFHDDFSILMDGVVSVPISFSSTADEVQEALMDMITINCQRTTNSRAYYSQDFEGMQSGYETGDRTTQAEPFCGRTSLKNPTNIFKAGETRKYGIGVSEFDAVYIKQLCFAFRGAITERLTLGVAWVNKENRQQYDSINVDYEAYPTTDWVYDCFNLEQKILGSGTLIAQNFKSTAGLKVRLIKVHGDHDAGFFIDNLYIGSSRDNYIRTSRVPKPNDVYMLNIEVEKAEDGDSFRFTFTAAECGYGIPLIGIEGAVSVAGSSEDDAVEYRNENWPTNVTLGVTREQSAAPPLGGTFDLIQDGVTIPGVKVQSSASRMKDLLQVHLNVGSINVERTGSCSGAEWDIYWLSKGGSQPLIEVNDTQVTGNQVTSSSERVVEGKVFVGPIPGEFLRTFHYTPQVEVMVNGIPSMCDGNCSFEFTSDATPTVTSVSPSSGNGCNGTSITLSGTGFSSVTGDNYVTIGGEECVVTSSNSTSIECTVGTTEAGYYNVSLLVEGKGYAEYPDGTFVFAHELEITSFSPTEGSRAGGSEITINGCGFSRHADQNSVTLGGYECKVTSAEHRKLVCIISVDTDNSRRKKRDSDVTLVVSVNGISYESSHLFSFSDALTPTITSMIPGNSSVLGGGNLTLSGSGFGTSDANITINGKECEILSQMDSEVVCIIPDNEPAAYPVELKVGTKGFADVSAVNKFEYILHVDSIFPDHGSLFGGTVVTVDGAGFGRNAEDISVSFGGFPCDIKSILEDEILCTTSDRGSIYKVKNNGKHETYGFGYKWNPAVMKIRAGDTIRWEWATPTHVMGIKYTVQQTTDADGVDYNGIGFYAGPAVRSGSYSYTFTAPGTYYYSSGPVDNADTLYMKGVIYVEPAVTGAFRLDVVIGGYHALHNAGWEEKPDSSSSVDVCSLQTQIQDCNRTTSKPEGTDPNKIYFSYYECSTPSVHNIDPIFGTSEDEITVTGKGFGPLACQNDLQFGGHSCNIVFSNETAIVCTLDVTEEPQVGYWLEIALKVGNRGYASILKNNPSERAYTLIPYVGSVSHQSGSTAGGLPITLVGTGFSALTQGAVSVFIGRASCEVSFFNYTMIICTTGKSSERTSLVAVTINAISADICKLCLFTYESESTATMDSVFPKEINGSSTVLTIVGEGFPSSNDSLTVTVNGVQCLSIFVSSNKRLINCDIGFVPIGTYNVIVNIANQGNAELNGADTQVESTSILYSVTPGLGSVEGGQLITIYGNGFHVDDSSVEISGKDCVIQSINISHIECTTPALPVDTYDVEVTSAGISYSSVSYTASLSVTPVIKSVTPSSGETGDSITIGGVRFTNVTSDLEVTIDGVSCEVTAVAENSIECTVGKHSAGSYEIEVLKRGIGYAKNYNITFTYSLGAFTNTQVECGFGGGIFLALNGSGFDEGNTKVFICGKECPIYTISASEITCDVPGTPVSGQTKVCDIVVSLPQIDVNVTVANNLTYHANLTSYITSVEPRRGGTGGGTLLTIAGSGFLSSGNKVTIAGTECEVQSESTSEIVCKTGAHSPTEMAKVRVDVGASGIAVQDDADFFYIDVWSSIYTWGGNDPPVEGDFAIIPEGQTILLDESTPVLKVLLLKGGHMVFDEKDIELHAEYIIITDGGSLTVGTEDEPFQHDATIMLHGHVRIQELPIFGAKVLAVRNGTLDLHGKPVAVTWTYLASTVSPGDEEMTLVQPVDWNVGDHIVIASTGDRHAQKENELLTITGISADNMTLTVTPPFNYTHISLDQMINGTMVETRAEVGLLSHNVKVRGSVHEEWRDKIEACDETFDTNQFSTQTCFLGRFGEETGSDQYGAHIMLFAKEMDKGWIKGRISYVEVTHAGQAFRLGRYPIHFHMSGDIRGSYVRGCGIYNTFNRAVTVHGVHGFLVEHNVAYNVMGHAFFLEDGIETGNVLQYNLAVFVRPSSSLLNVDITPAAYWITNPNNTVRHNAAAGGSHFGFWYNAPENPGGPSFTVRVWPRHIPLGEFFNNSAHTQGWYGLWIFPVYFPSKPAKFDTFFAWEVSKGAEAVEVGSVQLHNFLITDAHVAGLEFFTTFSVWGEMGSYVNNSVVIGYSEVNNNNATGDCTSVGVQLPKTTSLTVDGVKFINFDRPKCVCIKACKHCKADQGGFETRFKNLEWVNAPRRVVFKWEHECWLEDLDGTLTGGANQILLPQNDNLPPDHCEFGVEHSSSWAVPAAVCDETVTLHRMAWNNPLPASLHYKDVILTNRFGESVIPYHKRRLTHVDGWMATLVEKENYNMRFKNAEQITNISYTARFDSFVDGQYVYITHNFTQRPDAFSLVGRIWNGTKGIPDPVTSTHGDFTFNNNTKQLTYIVTGNGNKRMGNYFIDLDVYRCYYQNCIAPKPKAKKQDELSAVRRWSEAKSWKDAPANWGGNKGNGKYGLPQDGDNVQILPGVTMIADVALPWMHKLFIYGTLEFEDSRNFVVNATYIFIHGGRLVAGISEKEPFTHKLHFILQGNHLTPDIPLPNGPNMGSKVLGVFGELDLHGVARDVTWTRLGATARKGGNTLQLVEETDWVEGDEIMVTTTSFETWETETFSITEKIDKFNFRVNDSFRYQHIGNTHKLSDNSSVYTLSAEVGLLTRNIIIEGADYENLFRESFGARVIVGTFFQDGEEFKGQARISSVQFKRTGQEGWTDFYDPRYSLVFLNVGEVTEESPSYVRGCSFHNGFSTAIGVYGTHRLEVSDNVIHHVVGPGIVSWGEDTKFVHNLVSLVIFPGEYQDRYEPENLLWNGGIEVVNTRRPILINNTVAGSERVGFKIKGITCDEPSHPRSYGNVVHATLHGVHLFAATQRDCTMVSGFYIWNSFDYGIYAQIPSPVLVADSWLVDNKGGVLALIFAPGATSHKIVEKYVEIRDTVFVGTSPSFDCTAASPKAGGFTAQHRAPKAPGGGIVGFYFSAFMSEVNGAPFKPLHGVRSYPALRGVTEITGVTFAEYGDKCGRQNVVIMTNPACGDAFHPIQVKSLRLLNVLKGHYVFIHRPSLALVNPADCVDMDCDSMKKAMIRDLDGSLLGEVGTVIPQSEYEWNGDPRRGLGDYRIPRTMLTEPDGSRIPVADLAPNKGIYRGDGDCKWISTWIAYECHNVDHMMMIVESMDADTETRRVSPVSLYSDSYIDLINGPQDHGWCKGYTCQERISNFYTIVDTGRYYDLHFTGTSPQKLRYHLLNADDTQSVVVSTYYSNPQRLDVYVNGIYILPTNGDMEDGVFTWKSPEAGETSADYYPNLNSKVLGENYFDRDLDQLFILIRGSTMVEVLTTPVVMTTFGVPAVEVDNFFEENIIENLANLLDIPRNKIRIVEIISEDSRRRKRRATGEVEVVVEIGNPPSVSSSPTEASDIYNGTVVTPTDPPDGEDVTVEEELSFGALLEIQSTIANEMQTGGLEDAIGYHVTHLSMTDPVDTPVDPTGGVRATNETVGSANATGLRYDERQALQETETESAHTPVEYHIPSQLIVVTQPGDAVADYPFLIQPKVIVVDAQGNLVEQLGHVSHPWLLEVSLRENSTIHGAAISGNTTYSFTNGWVNYTDLAINTTGKGFILDFVVIYPSTISLATSSAEFEVAVRQYSLEVVDQPSVVNEGDQFDLVVAVRNRVTGVKPNSTGTCAATASLVMSSYYRGDLEGGVNVTVDLSTGLITFKNLSVSSSGVKYVVKVSIAITVSNYYIQQSLETEAFDVVDPDAVTHTGETVTLTLRFDADYDTVVAGQEEALEIYFLNHIAPLYENVTFSNVVISEGSVLITFDITGDVEDAQADMWEDILLGEMVLNFNGHTLEAEPYLLVDGEQYVGEVTCCKDVSTVSSILNIVLLILRIASFPFWAIFFIVILALIVIIIIILVIYKACFHKGSKVGSLTIEPHSPYVRPKQVSGVKWIPMDPHTSEVPEDFRHDGGTLITAPSSPVLAEPPREQLQSSEPSETPPGGSERQDEEDEKTVKKLIRMKMVDGTFKKLGKVEVNIAWNVQRIREELKTTALPTDIREKQFVLMDEQLRDLVREKEKSLFASEVYPGETVLIRLVEGDEPKKGTCICGLVGQLECSFCQEKSYCSARCQAADWTEHSKTCTIYNNQTNLNEDPPAADSKQ